MGYVLHIIEKENEIEVTPYDPVFDAQKISCVKIVTSCENWQNDGVNID